MKISQQAVTLPDSRPFIHKDPTACWWDTFCPQSNKIHANKLITCLVRFSISNKLDFFLFQNKQFPKMKRVIKQRSFKYIYIKSGTKVNEKIWKLFIDYADLSLST